MSIYIGLGKYSNNGAEGLIDGSSDRRTAMEKLTKSVGAKLIDYHITRGVYDFCIIVEADTFDMIAAMNLKAKAVVIKVVEMRHQLQRQRMRVKQSRNKRKSSGTRCLLEVL